MADIVISGNTSGSVTLRAPDVSGTTILTLPTTSGTIAVGGDSPSFTNLAYTGTLTGGTGVVNLGSGQFYKSAGGLVGINTASPSFTAGLGLMIQDATQANLRLDHFLNGGFEIQSVSSTLRFYSTAASAERMRIDSAGNVGIGTSSPAYQLNTSKAGGSGDAGQLVRFTNTSTGNSLGPFHLTIGTANYFAAAPSMVITGTNGLAFGVGDGSNLATQRQVFIDSSGNLLVGRTAPLSGGERFSVKQSGNAVGICVTSNAGPSIGNYESADDGRNAWWTFGRDNTTTGNFIFAYNGSARSNINLTTGNYTAVSDSRLKKDVTDLNYGLNEVLAMRPVSYLMEQEEDTAKKHLGFIAQEVKAVMDEAVDDLIDEDTQFYGLDKSGLVPVLVKAIQELNAKVIALEAQLGAK